MKIGLGYYPVHRVAINSIGHIFALTYRDVFLSTDNGDTWLKTGSTNTDINSIAINSVSSHIFVGTSGGVIRSTNNGESWTQINTGLTENEIYSLAVNFTNDIIFAGTYSGRVFRSVESITK